MIKKKIDKKRITKGAFCFWGKCHYLMIHTKANPFMGIKHKKLDSKFEYDMRIGVCELYEKVLETPQKYEKTCRRCLECEKDGE